VIHLVLYRVVLAIRDTLVNLNMVPKIVSPAHQEPTEMERSLYAFLALLVLLRILLRRLTVAIAWAGFMHRNVGELLAMRVPQEPILPISTLIPQGRLIVPIAHLEQKALVLLIFVTVQFK